MRKVISVLAVTALVSTASSPTAFGAVKAGSPCTKAGGTSTLAGMKYTCVKSGKKLMWSKGVVITTPTPTPSPTPTPTPSPTPTQSPSNSQQSAAPAPTQNSGKALRAADIQKTFKEIASRGDQVSPGKTDIQVISSDQVHPQSIQTILTRYEYITSFFAEFVSPTLPVSIVIGTNAEIAWINGQLEKLSGRDRKSFLDAFEAQSVKYPCGPFYTAGLNGKSKDGRILFHYALYGKSCPTQLPSDENFTSTIEHEWVHNVQGNLADPSMVGGGGQPLLPCWYREGQAALYGNVIGNRADYQNYLRVRAWNMRSFDPRMKFPNENFGNVLKRLDETYSNFTCGNDGGYSIGSIAVEKMILLKGDAGIVEFMRNVKTQSSWKKAFASVYGINADVWMDSISEQIRVEYSDLGM